METSSRIQRDAPPRYQLIGHPSAEDLNAAISRPLDVLKGQSVYDWFNENGLVTPFGPPWDIGSKPSMGASNGVDLYQVEYLTTIPGTKTPMTVSGLLAIPQLHPDRPLPMVSWQHGTIFEGEDAPSQIYAEQKLNTDALGIPRSIETLLTVIALAGNGYIVAAADYIGNGVSDATQAYAVKEATVQTIKDMLNASEAVLSHLNRRRSHQLFLHGWSQGGLNTLWLADALQDDSTWAPTRVSSVSAPSNLSRVCRYWMNQFPGDPNWLTPVVPILIGAYETYYQMSGLMAQTIRPQYLEIAETIYTKKYNWSGVDWSQSNPIRLPQDITERGFHLPARPIDMLNADFLDGFNHGEGQFYQQIHRNTALQGPFTMPCRFYGGLSDTVVPPWSAITCLEEHQRLQGNPLSTGVLVDGAIALTANRVGRAGGTHRSTFLASLFDPGLSVRRWFDEALESTP